MSSLVSSRGWAAGVRAVLSHWMDAYELGEATFASRAVFVEMRLRQALACTLNRYPTINPNSTGASEETASYSSLPCRSGFKFGQV